MKIAPNRPPVVPPAAYGPRAARALARLSVADLSKATGYSEGYLRILERDYLRVASGDKTARLAPLYAAQKIARALDMDVEIFYRLDPNRPTARKPFGSASGSTLSRNNPPAVGGRETTACAADSSAAIGMKNARNPQKVKSLHHSPTARHCSAVRQTRRMAATTRRVSPISPTDGISRS